MGISLNFIEGMLGKNSDTEKYDPNAIIQGTISKTMGNTVEKPNIRSHGVISSEDKTSEEIEKEKAEELLQEAYQREDEIRKETQEREDNAYQRAVEDMQKAGINPNIFAGAGAAASGGGITNASRADLTLVKAKYEAGIQMLMQQIANEFNADQKTRDRLTSIANNIMKIFM